MKIKKLTTKTFISILIPVIVVISSVTFYLLFLRKDDEVPWYDSNWTYRKSISIETTKLYEGIEEDVLVEIDTATLISEGKLVNDCRDIRFVDEQDRSTLVYWIEGGCNTSETQIWVKVKLSTSSKKIIYMYYGNNLAVDTQEPWSGEFISMSTQTCQNNWEISKDFEGRFPLGSEEFGSIGGQEEHTHKISVSDNQNCQNLINVVDSEGSNCDTDNDNILNLTLTSFTNIPDHENLNFCKSKNGFLDDSTIILLDQNTPKGWTHLSLLDDKFVRGNDDETNLYSEKHIHSPQCLNSDLITVNGAEEYATLTDSANLVSEAIEIPYYKVNFVTNPNGSPILPGSIMMVTSLPPLGWEEYTKINGFFPRGSEKNFKESGGNNAHFHFSNLDISINNSTKIKLGEIDSQEICVSDNTFKNIKLSDSRHLPPYISTPFAKKKISVDSGIKVTLNQEEIQKIDDQVEKREQKITQEDEIVSQIEPKDQGDVLGALAPTSPTDILTEGETNPTNLKDTTPEFSAIYNDPDSNDTSSYYEIEVNTSSDFTGTVMWDSTKSTMTTTNQGSRTPDISYAGSTLSEDTTYYWRIRLWDSDDNVSDWSSNGTFDIHLTPTATSLLTCGNSDPTYITSPLTFSSIYTDPNGDNSSNYEIEVNTASNFSGTVMWDTGKTASTITSGNRSNEFEYGGTALTQDGTTYYVRMRFWDSDDNVSDWVTGQFVDIIKGFLFNGLNIDGIRLD